jgi:hypothetical protein
VLSGFFVICCIIAAAAIMHAFHICLCRTYPQEMMMIKTFLICTAALAALSGCMTPRASNAPLGEVPASRIYIKEMTVSTAGQNQITIDRDPHLLPGGSKLEFSINYVALADMLPGETFSAWLPDGTYTFSIKPNPNPQKLAPRAITLTLQKGQKHILRADGSEFGTTLEEVGAK